MSLRKLVVALLALALCACASAPRPISSRQLPAGWTAQDVAFRAIGLVGTPYVRAGASPQQGFDCSGFVQFVYRDARGIGLPRSTREQLAYAGDKVSRKALQTGDLVFFDTGGNGVSHVGIYVGEGRFVHAPNHGGRVRLDRLDDRYWASRYLAARRVE